MRSSGVWRRKRWMNKKEYRNHFRKVMGRPNKVFDTHFDSKGIERKLKSKEISIVMYLQIIKLKEILDIIESRSYKKFVGGNR